MRSRPISPPLMTSSDDELVKRNSTDMLTLEAMLVSKDADIGELRHQVDDLRAQLERCRGVTTTVTSSLTCGDRSEGDGGETPTTPDRLSDGLSSHEGSSWLTSSEKSLRSKVRLNRVCS